LRCLSVCGLMPDKGLTTLLIFDLYKRKSKMSRSYSNDVSGLQGGGAMKTRNSFPRRGIVSTLFLFLVALLSFPALLSRAELQLGKITFPDSKVMKLSGAHLLDEPAPPLKNPTPVSRGIKSHAFVSSVGGVAFGGVASLEKGWSIADLAYHADKPDGQRLEVTLVDPSGKSQTVTAAIHDWQLVPIAEFAADEQHAIFTLFGELKDKEREKYHRERGHHILNYNSAFEDSLLGLRLFQADVLILREYACDLPKQNDDYVLGAGESPPDVQANRRALASLHEHMGTGKQKFQSYVICDHGSEVKASAQDGKLMLTGRPFWYFWRTADDKDLMKVQEAANRLANRKIREELEIDKKIMSYEELTQKYTPEYQRRRHGEIFDEVVSKELLRALPKLSKDVSDRIKELGGVNPEVYESLTAVMRYAAFFRLVQKTKKDQFSEFLSSVQNIETSPGVNTPTVLMDPK